MRKHGSRGREQRPPEVTPNGGTKGLDEVAKLAEQAKLHHQRQTG